MFGPLRGFELSLFDEFRRLQRDVEDIFVAARPADTRLSPEEAVRPGLVRSGLAGSGMVSPGPMRPGAFSAVNVLTTAQQVDVYLTAPGIDPKTLNVSIQRNVLSVSGRRDAQAQQQATLRRRERFSGEFSQVLTLPEDVDAGRVSASYVDGVVRITVQRQEQPQPRQIQIH